MDSPLDGMRILLLEDEFLIALDVEQLCRDAGAGEVTLARTMAEAEKALSQQDFDAAIVDVMLGSEPTFPFAHKLRGKDVPFVFASGYVDMDEMRRAFPDVRVCGKPYSGDDLIEALAKARLRIAGPHADQALP